MESRSTKNIANTIDRIEFLHFLDYLRYQKGFNIGIREYIAAQELGTIWESLNDASPSRLRRMLGPLLCSAPSDINSFNQVFDRWESKLFIRRRPNLLSDNIGKEAFSSSSSSQSPHEVKKNTNQLISHETSIRWKIAFTFIIILVSSAFLFVEYFRVNEPSFGTLIVETDPKDAQVWINDVLFPEITPFVVDTLIPASYSLRVKLPYYEQFDTAYTVVAEKETSVNIKLSSLLERELLSNSGGFSDSLSLPEKSESDSTTIKPSIEVESLLFGDSLKGIPVSYSQKNTHLAFSEMGDHIAFGHPSRGITFLQRNSASNYVLPPLSLQEWRTILESKLYPVSFRPKRILLGHTGFVWSVDISPAGDRIVSGGSDGNIRIWDRQSGQELLLLQGYGGTVWSVDFSPEGDRIASGGSDGVVRVWDTFTGELLNPMVGHFSDVRSAAFDPSGNLIASAGRDGTVRIWNSRTGRLYHQLKGHAGWVRKAEFSPTGDRIASAGSDSLILIWDVASGSILNVIEGHNSIVWDLDFSPSGDRIAASSSEGYINIWNTENGVLSAQVNNCSYSAWSVDFSPSGDQIITGSSDGAICVLDLVAKENVQRLDGHFDIVWDVSFNKEGNHFVSGGSDGSVRIWSPENTQQQRKIGIHKGLVRDVLFSPSGEWVSSAGGDGVVRIWNVSDGKELLSIPTDEEFVRTVAFSPLGDRISFVDNNGTVWIASTTILGEARKLFEHPSIDMSIHFSPSGDSLVTGGSDGILRIWESSNGMLLTQLIGGLDKVHSVVYSPSGNYIASGGTNGIVEIWDSSSKIKKHTLEGHEGIVRSVQFSPLGDHLVSGGSDGKVLVWDINSGDQVNIFEGHVGVVWSVSFDPSGDRIVSGGSDGTIRLWDLNSGDQINILESPSGLIRSVDFSPFGDKIVSGGSDGTITIWWAVSGWQPSEMNRFSQCSDRVPRTKLGVSAQDHEIVLYDSYSHIIRGTIETLAPPECVAFINEDYLLYSGADSTLNFLDYSPPFFDNYNTYKLNHKVSVLTSWSKGQYAATTGLDSLILIWDVNQLTIKDTLYLPEKDIISIDINEDESQLAVLTGGNQIFFWELGSSKFATLIEWLANIWFVIFICSSVLVTLLVIWHRKKRLKQYLIRQTTQEEPDLRTIYFEGIEKALFPVLEIYRVSQQMRRRKEVVIQELAIQETIIQTVHSAGVFSPMLTTRKVVPEYLVLIDRTTISDQQTAYINDLIDCLETNEIITRYYFDNDLRLCLADSFNINPMSPSNLVRKYPSHRLLIFSNGDGFFDPITGNLTDWTEQFYKWPHRFIFVLPTVDRVSYKLSMLAKMFVILPATTSGLAEMITYFHEKTAVPTETHQFASFPKMLRNRPLRWIERDSPDKMQVDNMLNSVKAYLGPTGYHCLIACAFYPEMFWKLTVNLVFHLKDIKKESVTQVNILASLARLPWFRHNYMPDWLRLRLIKDLSGKEERHIRLLILALLNKAVVDPEGPFDLEIALERHTKLKKIAKIIWLQFSKEGHSTGANPLGDKVFLKFIRGRSQEKLAIRISRALSSLLLGKEHLYRREQEDARLINWILGLGILGLYIVTLVIIWGWNQIPEAYVTPSLVENWHPNLIVDKTPWWNSLWKFSPILPGVYLLIADLRSKKKKDHCQPL